MDKYTMILATVTVLATLFVLMLIIVFGNIDMSKLRIKVLGVIDIEIGRVISMKKILNKKKDTGEDGE